MRTRTEILVILSYPQISLQDLSSFQTRGTRSKCRQMTFVSRQTISNVIWFDWIWSSNKALLSFVNESMKLDPCDQMQMNKKKSLARRSFDQIPQTPVKMLIKIELEFPSTLNWENYLLLLFTTFSSLCCYNSFIMLSHKTIGML